MNNLPKILKIAKYPLFSGKIYNYEKKKKIYFINFKR